MKSEFIPFAEDQEPRETVNCSEVEMWQRFRNSSDAGVRVIELAFIKHPLEFIGSKASPVVETTSREESESTLRIREFFGFRFGKPRVFKFRFPDKVNKPIFLWRPKLPYSND